MKKTLLSLSVVGIIFLVTFSVTMRRSNYTPIKHTSNMVLYYKSHRNILADLLGGKTAKENYAVVKIFYVTDRNRIPNANPSMMYGSGRGEISYGTCAVSIPKGFHRIGELETPSIWKLEFVDDPNKHIVLLNVSVQDKDRYFSEVANCIRNSSKKSAFIFVHGYNVTFEDAVRRTAQITYDLNFDGASVCYSWPSKGTIRGYPADETNIEWTQTNLKHFLEDFVARTGAENIYLIAHSMGNRALSKVFGEVIAKAPDLSQRFRELILTAPDIDAEVFKKQIAPQIINHQTGITLYASSKDSALELSKQFHAYSRIGNTGPGLAVIPGIETIDATNVDTSFLGHTYFPGSRSVLYDIFSLIQDGKRADKRFALKPVETSSGRYWIIKP